MPPAERHFPHMKRFWKSVLILTDKASYSIELDGRPVKLPSGKPLALSSRPLAEAIAEEWQMAPEQFLPDHLPLTRLASTALERIAPHRADILDQLTAYGMNDLLCYRAPPPDDLTIRQSKAWNPWLTWARENYGITLQATMGLVPINQPPGTREAFRGILTAHSDDALAALGVIVPALGSLVLGLAIAAMALEPEAACAASFLDELWQEEHWGADSEAVKRRTKIIEDVAVSARFMQLCSP